MAPREGSTTQAVGPKPKHIYIPSAPQPHCVTSHTIALLCDLLVWDNFGGRHRAGLPRSKTEQPLPPEAAYHGYASALSNTTQAPHGEDACTAHSCAKALPSPLDLGYTMPDCVPEAAWFLAPPLRS